jgi:hypothetical protein
VTEIRLQPLKPVEYDGIEYAALPVEVWLTRITL